MAEINQTSTPLSAALGRALPPLCMSIFGKIEAVRKFGEATYTRVVCPAPDLYSKPSIIEIRSSGRIGSRDEEIKVVGRLSGYTRKPYEVKDKDGEIFKITPVEHTVDLVI